MANIQPQSLTAAAIVVAKALHNLAAGEETPQLQVLMCLYQASLDGFQVKLDTVSSLALNQAEVNEVNACTV